VRWGVCRAEGRIEVGRGAGCQEERRGRQGERRREGTHREEGGGGREEGVGRSVGIVQGGGVWGPLRSRVGEMDCEWMWRCT